MTLDPPGPELAAKNRRILAERVGWPGGAVEACEAFDATHPEWSATWHAGNDARPAPGYYAVRRKAVHGEPMAYGATVQELAEQVDGWPYHDPWDQPFVPL